MTGQTITLTNVHGSTVTTADESVGPAPAEAIAWKCADPIEGPRWITDEGELVDIRLEDESLLYYVGPIGKENTR